MFRRNVHAASGRHYIKNQPLDQGAEATLQRESSEQPSRTWSWRSIYRDITGGYGTSEGVSQKHHSHCHEVSERSVCLRNQSYPFNESSIFIAAAAREG